MGLENFHPKRAVLLDGFALIEQLDLGYDVRNKPVSNFVANLILEQVVLTPWVPYRHESSHWPYWLYVKHKINPSVEISPIFNILFERPYNLTALLPSGKFIKNFRVNNFISTFEDEEGDSYVETSENTFISLKPSFDERFLKFYDVKEFTDYSDDVTGVILRTLNRKLRVTPVQEEVGKPMRAARKKALNV